MRTIKEILHVQKHISRSGSEYFTTLARLDDNEIYEAYGSGFAVGDKVEAFYDDKWDKPKFQKKRPLTL